MPLFVAALFAVGYARQPILRIDERMTIIIGFGDSLPMGAKKRDVACDPCIGLELLQEQESDIHMREHVGVVCPMHETCTLGHLVPHHSGLLVLVFEQKFKSLACSLELA